MIDYAIYENVCDLTTFCEVAKEHGHDKLYPYAYDMVAHYMFGDRDIWNLYYQLERGEGGKGHSCCLEDGGYQLNGLMITNENTWKEYLDELNDWIGDLPLKNSEKVRDRY